MKLRRKTPKTDKSFAALRSLMWHYKWRFLTNDILRMLAAISIAIQPIFLAKFASSINDKSQAFMYLMLLLGTGIVHTLLWHPNDYFLVKYINPMTFKMKQIAFTIFWDKKYTSFIEKPSGKVGYYINQMPYQVYQLYDSYHYGFLVFGVSIPVYATLLFSAIWQVSVIYLVFLTITFAMLVALTIPISKNQRKYTDADSSTSGRVFDSYANFVNVFSFRAHSKEVKRTVDDLDEVVRLNVKSDYKMMNYWSTAAFMIRFCLWSVIIFYSWHLYDTNEISFTSLLVSITVLYSLTNQFWEVVHHVGQWNKIQSTYREAYNYLFPNQNIVLDYFNKQRTYLNTTDVTFKENLTIDNVSFAYPDAPDNAVLKNINLSVNKNEKIGIVGKSGSGKSTLVKILLGFYNIEDSPYASGSILVDENRIHNNELSQLYAYVPQDTTLFQESIYYNIAYAKDGETTHEEVLDAAKKAHIDEFVDSLPDGYDTLVGERGVKLSLGQRQRIAIARAFLKQSDLLILDEATSSLDSVTEGLVQESFEKLWAGKSVIAIAHRLSTLNNVDRIIVMSNGEIVEQGTKDELLARDGHFADLWKHQRKGMI